PRACLTPACASFDRASRAELVRWLTVRSRNIARYAWQQSFSPNLFVDFDSNPITECSVIPRGCEGIGPQPHHVILERSEGSAACASAQLAGQVSTPCDHEVEVTASYARGT